MSPLDRKLLRDLWRVKGQAVAIALVIGTGVLLLVMMGGLVTSLEETRRAYYERYRLAEVFAPLSRAPRHVLRNLADVPGVTAVEGRIQGGALIDLPGVPAPLRAQAVSLPDYGPPRLNDVHLTAGRRIDPGREDEILLIEGFAVAHALQPGDTIAATMNGARRTFRIAGLAQSPEFLYATAPGEIVPDDARFAVIWMGETAMAAAYDMEGAFNEALIALGRGAALPGVLDRIDRLLEPYGGLGAYGLSDQFSNRFLSEEIAGLRITSRTVPPIFLAVAAFLLNIVVSRMVQAEREQIGLLKAFGYSGLEVSAHYFKFVLSVAVGGAILGCLGGVLGGRSLASVYQLYYKFPFLIFQVDPMAFVAGAAASVVAASTGGLLVLGRVFSLTPAVAMRPSAPADFSRAVRLGGRLKGRLDQPSRMIVRRLARQPLRAMTAVLGIGAGMAISVAMLSVMASFERTVDLSFRVIDRSDVTVTLIDALSETIVHELQGIDGVIEVEPFRSVPAILRNGLRTYRGGIEGLVAEPRLNRPIDGATQPLRMRADGVVVGTALADILGLAPGDALSVEVKEGHRLDLRLPVVAVADTLMGAPAYMEIDALNRALREPDRISGAHLRIDADRSAAVYRQIKNMPAVAGVSLREEARAALRKAMDSGAGATRFIMMALAAVITFGIVYNSARIAFAERERDLASLRVIGFTRAEASYILLGELAIIVVLALPTGAVLGQAMAQAVSAGFSTELYRIPTLFDPRSHGVAALAVMTAAVASGLIVKRDIDRIDLVSALKTRE